jgi:hypothetical protein
MGTNRVGTWCVVVVLATSALACTSTKSRCETVCDWLKSCAGGDVTCSDSDIDKCVDEYDDKGDSCQDAFDEFSDCVDDNESCDKVQKECIGEATEYVSKCG